MAVPLAQNSHIGCPLHRRRFFQVKTNARLLPDTLRHYRRLGLYKLPAIAVMSRNLRLGLTI